MRRSHILLLVIVLALASLALYFFLSTSKDSVRAIEAYRTQSAAHIQAAYVPGVPGNPARERLNTILSSVLVRPLTPGERTTLAEEGLRALKEVEVQIDAIGEAGERVQVAIAYLEEKTGGFAQSDEEKELIAAAEEEFSIIADIRGLSYRANFHTAEIFNRIILDGGELTSVYSADLNRELPLVEEQFNARASLYERLKNARTRVDAALVRMGEPARE